MLTLEEKFNFLNEILSAPVPEMHKVVNELDKIINTDYRDFAKRENSLADEAGAYNELLSVFNRIRRLLLFSKINSKGIIAVGGAFSSGKSSFVNSLFFDKKISLPVNINPTTTIPVYVINSQQIEIKGCSFKGGIFDIKSHIFSKITHNFVKDFTFNLKEILPFMMLGVPFHQRLSRLKNICIIDTPGFSYDKDDDVAYNFLNESDAIIWVIDIKNGTIRDTDLDILLKIKPTTLYIILNKGDLIPFSEQKKIIAEVKETLDLKEIDFEGISVYSATKSKEFFYDKKSIYHFLEEVNSFIFNKKENFINKVKRVFEEYIDAIENDIEEIEKEIERIHSFELDLYQYFDISENLYFKESKENMKEAKDVENGIFSKKDFSDALHLAEGIKEDAVELYEKLKAESFNASLLVSVFDSKINDINDKIKKIEQLFENNDFKKSTHEAFLKALKREINYSIFVLKKVEKRIKKLANYSPKLVPYSKFTYIYRLNKLVNALKNNLYVNRTGSLERSFKKGILQNGREDNLLKMVELVKESFIIPILDRKEEIEDLKALKKEAEKLRNMIIKKINECFTAMV